MRVAVSLAPLSSLVAELVAAAHATDPTPDAHGSPASGPRDDSSVGVRVLVPPGVSEHAFELTPGDVTAIAQADVLVVVGVGLDTAVESVVKKLGERAPRVVRFEAVVGRKAVQAVALACEHPESEHAGGHDHHHESWDPHLWLDPVLVRALVPEVAHAVRAAAETGPDWTPDRAVRLNDAADALIARIDAMDVRYRETIAALPNRRIVTAHAAWGRIASRYGLEIVGEVLEAGGEGAEVGAGRAAQLIRAMALRGVGGVFVEPQVDRAAAQRIAEAAGVPVGELDPIGTGDWFDMMDRNLAELVRVLGSAPAPAPAPASPASR